MVKVIYWKGQEFNIGDQLAHIIVEWIVKKASIQDKSRKDLNLLTVGSILAADFFNKDAIVWGTGIHYIEDPARLAYRSKERRLDIRAVRGPITRRALEQSGYPCPHTYGDPAILMPLIYPKKEGKIEGKISIIRHLQDVNMEIPQGINKIDVRTNDYRKFIDEICTSERIISSSLHGIILGECYQVPSVLLLEHENSELIKYFDWYYSTGRINIKIAHSVEEAMEIEPMEVPQIKSMQKNLLNAFPTDAYQETYTHIKKKEVVLFGTGKNFQNMVERIKEKVKIRYVCDNDSAKWGKSFCGLTCISPNQLYTLKNIYVVITIENGEYVKEVQDQIDKNGIKFFEQAYQWLRHVNYDKYVS